jgi:hypothetical protein
MQGMMIKVSARIIQTEHGLTGALAQPLTGKNFLIKATQFHGL